MAIRQIRQPSGGMNSRALTIPAPRGGWNARDNIVDMALEDAYTLINWETNATDVSVRNGYTNHVTGITGQVQSLMVYNSATTSKLFGAANLSIYDVSAAGAVGAASVSGTTNNKWQYVNITTAGGSFLLNVNGAEKLRGYDGTSWYQDGDGSHDITGLDTATVSNINLHNNRIWLVPNNSLKAWYLGTNSISGAATAFDLSSIAIWGGHLVAMATWTIDAGYGLNDHAVFVTSMGEVIVYIGIDPSSTATWAKIGQWKIGSPIGNRCFLKWGGDLLLITFDGVVPLAQGLQSSRLDPRINLTDKIRGAMATATSTYSSNFGWQLQDYPKGSKLILNVPVSEGSAQEQYVMSTVTKNWFQCQGFNANCWALFNDSVYFGADSFVGLAFNGLSDASANINGTAVQAFNDFGSPGINKRFTMMQPIFNTNGSPQISAGINVDFNIVTPNSSLSTTSPGYALWDGAGAVWDGAMWGGGLSVTQSWQGINGIGKYAGPTLQSATNGIELHWAATRVVYEPGGIV